MQAIAVIGGGFFGCAIALHLKRLGCDGVVLLERERELLQRASYSNQARVHNGYHYPRAFLTAFRSRANLPRFCADYGHAVKRDMTSIYMLAAQRSKVMPQQFERFMMDIGAEYERLPPTYRGLFNPRLVAAAYLVQEYAFDAAQLRVGFGRDLTAAGVDVRLGTEVTALIPQGNTTRLTLETGETLDAACVINCTYARSNFTVARGKDLTPLKHEIAEVALVDVPAALENIGVTLMDGPFFSCMPFPAAQCHSLTHVRYTPHGAFLDDQGARDPLQHLEATAPQSRVSYMIADAARYLPCLQEVRHRRSLFEIKTVLARNEVDDGRPILLRKEPEHAHLYTVLGGKLDNIYDVLERLETEIPHPARLVAA